MKKIFVINASDNVGTAVVSAISQGDTVETNGELLNVRFTALNAIAYGHKIAIKDIKQGETVLKYGLSIGTATKDIQQGEHVHTHNVESNRGRGDLVSDTSKVAAE